MFAVGVANTILPIFTDQSEIAQKVTMSACRHQYTSCCLATSPLKLAGSITLCDC